MRSVLCKTTADDAQKLSIQGRSIYKRQHVLCCYPTPSKDGSMVKDYGALDAGQLSTTWTKQSVVKEHGAQRGRSWTAQNEMRGVLGRMFDVRLWILVSEHLSSHSALSS